MISSPVRLVVSVSLSILIATQAASAATLTGRVVDPDGRAVAGATVIAVGETPLRSAITNTRGEFSLDVPDGVTFEVRVAFSGFRSEKIAVDDARDATLGEIRLSLSAVSESVVVSAAQVEQPLSEAASTVTVITAADLARQQLLTVADALRSVPGLTVAATGGDGASTGVFPRGGESNFTLVFVDDVPVNAFGGEYDFAHLSTANVERIEIVRGPQSALFGSNAIGGVVRVITRRGGAPMASAVFEGGGYDMYRLAGQTSGSAGAFEWGASVERMASDGYNGRISPSGLTVENDDYERTSGAVSAGWRRREASLRGFVRYDDNERGTPGPFGSNPIGAYGGIDTVSRGDNRETTVSVSAVVPLSPSVRALFQTGYYRLRSDFTNPDFFNPGAVFESQSSTRRWEGRGQIDFAMTPRLQVTAGAEVQRERAGSTFIVDASFEEAPVKRTIAGYFGEARWNTNDRLFLTGGVRVDDIRRDPLGGAAAADDDHVLSLNPRIAAAWLVNPKAPNPTRLRGSAATGIRPPGAFDIAFTDNPSLKPEQSVSFEAAVEQTLFSGRARLDAIAFLNSYDDLIVAVGAFDQASQYMTDNIANAMARGVELGFTVAHRFTGGIPIDLQARAAYTFLDSEVRAIDDQRAAQPPFAVGDPLLRRPRHQMSADVNATAGALGAFFRGRGRGRFLDVEPSTGTFGGLFYADGFAVWDVGASWRLRQSVEFFGRVENLFDRRYEEALGFPAQGRRAVGGIRVAASR